jgi:hypothetical protein
MPSIILPRTFLLILPVILKLFSSPYIPHGPMSLILLSHDALLFPFLFKKQKPMIFYSQILFFLTMERCGGGFFFCCESQNGPRPTCLLMIGSVQILDPRSGTGIHNTYGGKVGITKQQGRRWRVAAGCSSHSLSSQMSRGKSIRCNYEEQTLLTLGKKDFQKISKNQFNQNIKKGCLKSVKICQDYTGRANHF